MSCSDPPSDEPLARRWIITTEQRGWARDADHTDEGGEGGQQLALSEGLAEEQVGEQAGECWGEEGEGGRVRQAGVS